MFVLENSNDAIKASIGVVHTTDEPVAIVTYEARFKGSEVPEELTVITGITGASTLEILSWINNPNIVNLRVKTIHIHNADSVIQTLTLLMQKNSVEYVFYVTDLAVDQTLILASDGSITLAP